MLERADARAGYGRLLSEVIREAERERLDVRDRVAARERVHRVLHRVGREARAVVAGDVHIVERALELHVDREIDDVVWIAGVRAAHLHEAHARFAVPVPGEHATRLDTSCSRRGSGAAGCGSGPRYLSR